MGQVQKVVLRLKQSPFPTSFRAPDPKTDFFHDPDAEFPSIWLQTEDDAAESLKRGDAAESLKRGDAAESLKRGDAAEPPNRQQQVQVTAWAGGPKASALRGLSPGELCAHAIRAVARTLSSDVARIENSVIESHSHDFGADPLSQGAYSYVRPGGLHAARKLALPLENTLFFCGEALDLAYPGTVAGALGSGQHAARQILASLASARSSA
jgi:hypothetical protein